MSIRPRSIIGLRGVCALFKTMGYVAANTIPLPQSYIGFHHAMRDQRLLLLSSPP